MKAKTNLYVYMPNVKRICRRFTDDSAIVRNFVKEQMEQCLPEVVEEASLIFRAKMAKRFSDAIKEGKLSLKDEVHLNGLTSVTQPFFDIFAAETREILDKKYFNTDEAEDVFDAPLVDAKVEKTKVKKKEEAQEADVAPKKETKKVVKKADAVPEKEADAVPEKEDVAPKKETKKVVKKADAVPEKEADAVPEKEDVAPKKETKKVVKPKVKVSKPDSDEEEDLFDDEEDNQAEKSKEAKKPVVKKKMDESPFDDEEL